MHRLALVVSEIVDGDDAARLERMDQNLLDIGTGNIPLVGQSITQDAAMRSRRGRSAFVSEPAGLR
jgi:hypothetical protein